jgi:carboxymethylenebutenolidase
MPDFKQYLVDEYIEDFEKGHLTRRQALKMLAGVTGSLTVANTLLAACASPPTETAATAPATTGAAASSTAAITAAATSEATSEPAAAPEGVLVPEDDPAIEAMPVQFPSGEVTLMGYLARPAGGAPATAILVCHENRGLTPYIENVARRLGKVGYAALAVDLLSRDGGTAALNEEDIPGLLTNAPEGQFVADFTAGRDWLVAQNYATPGPFGMVGFCFGGGVTWQMAANAPDLKAAVPFYGPPIAVEEVPNVQGAVLAIYAGDDTRITSTLPTIEPAMVAAGKSFDKEVYPHVDHAFHNDTRERYNPEQAEAAWARTLAFFQEQLG